MKLVYFKIHMWSGRISVPREDLKKLMPDANGLERRLDAFVQVFEKEFQREINNIIRQKMNLNRKYAYSFIEDGFYVVADRFLDEYIQGVEKIRNRLTKLRLNILERLDDLINQLPDTINRAYVRERAKQNVQNSFKIRFIVFEEVNITKKLTDDKELLQDYLKNLQPEIKDKLKGLLKRKFDRITHKDRVVVYSIIEIVEELSSHGVIGKDSPLYILIQKIKQGDYTWKELIPLVWELLDEETYFNVL